MKQFYLLLLLAVPFLSFSQNNAPVAVNDTFYVDFNDSLEFYELIGFGLASNDSDPDMDQLWIDSIIYNGSATISLDSITSGVIKFKYNSAIGYVGVDSARYILKDRGFPNLFDTAWVYFYVKNPEYAYLDMNNIAARFGLYGLFQDKVNAIASFNVPKQQSPNDPKLTTMFAANLWLSGKLQDSVHLNAETFGTSYGYNDPFEFKAPSGPIMDSAEYPEYSYKWDRLWKITSADIDYHKNNYMNSGYQPIEVIKNWPGNGDVSKGQAYQLAPFFDNNNDGFYDPLAGDYPLIKGQQAVYFIYNDIRWQALTDKPMNTEVHYMAYAYNCPQDSALFNTIFIDYTIYNRSVNTYDSTYVGFWADLDIGGSTDDFVGCDVMRNSFYAYNGDPNDEGGNGVDGYLTHPPAQSVTLLKGVQQDNDGIDNSFGVNPNESVNGTGFGDAIIDNEYWGLEHFMAYSIGNGQFPGDGDPINTADYYNYMRGRWRDGGQMVWGGNGSPTPGPDTIIKYMYPDTSDPYFYSTGGIPVPAWSESNSGSQPGDRRGIGSTGPFTFSPGARIDISLAFVFGRDYQNTGNLAGVAVMQERVDSIRSYYENGFTTTACGLTLSVNEEELPENDLVIYPNPFNETMTIEYELENRTGKLRVISMVGQVVHTQAVNSYRTTLDLSELSNGIYFVQVMDGSKIVTKKVLKQ